jgi:FxsC-like protein
MPYECFFSYAREDRTRRLDRFVDGLRKKLGLCKRLAPDEAVFFDGESIDAGAPWKQTLSTALRTSRVFLSVCTPNYINSDYCGKEFQVFLERYWAYERQAAREKPPNLIIPVLWGPPQGSVRDVIKQFQYTKNKFPAVYAQEGLAYMMELKAHADDYKKFITRLAETIVAASDAHPMPDLAQLRPLENVKSAFHDAAQSESEEGDRAWFVFVAAKPDELSAMRTSVDRYRKGGGRDWRPFHPDVKEPVGLLAQQAASQYNRYFTELPIDGRLFDALDQAERTREPVLVLVDPWTLRVANYGSEMRRLDQNIRDTCAILVSWNVPDPDTDAERDALTSLLAQTFNYRIKGGRPFHYWGEVGSAAELRARLLDVLAHYTNKEAETTQAKKKIPQEAVVTAENDPGVPLGRPPVVDNGPGAANG